MSRRIDEETKREAIRLRVEERLGLKAICRETGLSRGSASTLLRDYPLTDEEVRQRLSRSAHDLNERCVRYAPEPSKYFALAPTEMSSEQKARVAEAAVLFRLTLFGYEAWRSPFEGHRVDWLVTQPGNRRSVRLQVRWARRGHYGRPLISLRRCSGTESLTEEDCDFLVGYDLETDTVFVIPMGDLSGKRYVTFCHPKYAEAWGSLFGSTP